MGNICPSNTDRHHRKELFPAEVAVIHRYKKLPLQLKLTQAFSQKGWAVEGNYKIHSGLQYAAGSRLC